MTEAKPKSNGHQEADGPQARSPHPQSHAPEPSPEQDEVRTEEEESSLKERLARTEEELKMEHDRFLRALADMDNYKRRVAREREELTRLAATPVLLEILPVMDSLERAEAAVQDGVSEQVLREGISVTLKQFSKGLEKLGVTVMDALGKPFDPNLHDALGHKETGDMEPDAVAEVVQKGYLWEGKILRHAVVRVAKAPEENTEYQ
jgi:molecular chaperone GrpE